MFSKPITMKNKKYLEWVKTQQCLCKYHQGESLPENFNDSLGLFNIIDPHHVMERSRDDMVVPLCRWSHSLTESVAPSEWQEVMGFTQEDLEESAKKLREEFMKGGNNV